MTYLQLEDYLPYVGCELLVEVPYPHTGRLEAVNQSDNALLISHGLYRLKHSSLKLDWIKPVLRPMTSMTPEEAVDLLRCLLPESSISLEHIRLYPFRDDHLRIRHLYYSLDFKPGKVFAFLGKRTYAFEGAYGTAYWQLWRNHFDTWGYIQRGLAVSTTKLPQPVCPGNPPA